MLLKALKLFILFFSFPFNSENLSSNIILGLHELAATTTVGNKGFTQRESTKLTLKESQIRRDVQLIGKAIGFYNPGRGVKPKFNCFLSHTSRHRVVLFGITHMGCSEFPQ